jgi:CheY-like chemotaxis protein
MHTLPLRILHAEDGETSFYEAFLRHVLPDLLVQPTELTYVHVLDGLSALRCLREQRFDLLVADVSIPGVDGWELVQRVRAGETETGPGSTSRTVLILVFTAHSLEQDRTRAADVGADAYLAKPAEPRRFAEVVVRLLRTR